MHLADKIFDQVKVLNQLGIDPKTVFNKTTFIFAQEILALAKENDIDFAEASLHEAESAFNQSCMTQQVIELNQKRVDTFNRRVNLTSQKQS